VSAASAPGPAASVPGPDEVRVADPDRRFYAFAIDRLIAWGIDVAVAVVAWQHLLSRGHVATGVVVTVATVLLVGLAFAFLLGATGATPGMSVTGLRLVHTGTGDPIGVGAAVLRTFVLGLAVVPFGFGLAVLAWTCVADTTRLRRGWHDHLVSAILLDARPAPLVEGVADSVPRHVVNLTALRLAPSRRTPEPPAPPTPRVPARHAAGPHVSTPSARLPAATWGLVLDTGERVVVDTLVLLGRRPEPRPGEQGARLVAVGSADLSVSTTHAEVVVAADRALVVSDRGSAQGSVLVRKGMLRPLPAGRPTTLLEGDVLRLGDRTLTVELAREVA